ncbi:50S ribosomal protein L23 [Legionella pneumophila]|uniref:50S ribosomal protein L23 n=1 Tax=Legionella pneumophila TaxID=446 RepID=UPI0005C42E74|nr:50S ribosomal protein L23 [Legionella pneumophila]GAN28784.1 50S ribosomal protein L23 [Legionella pneumophila]
MNAERLMMVLREPHTSEKATVMADKFKQFTFKVLKNATKTEIKLAVEHIFNVKVESVSVVNVKGKSKRFKQTSGKRSDWKKAFVSLHADQDIDFTVTE